MNPVIKGLLILFLVVMFIYIVYRETKRSIEMKQAKKVKEAKQDEINKNSKPEISEKAKKAYDTYHECRKFTSYVKNVNNDIPALDSSQKEKVNFYELKDYDKLDVAIDEMLNSKKLTSSNKLIKNLNLYYKTELNRRIDSCYKEFLTNPYLLVIKKDEIEKYLPCAENHKSDFDKYDVHIVYRNGDYFYSIVGEYKFELKDYPKELYDIMNKLRDSMDRAERLAYEDNELVFERSYYIDGINDATYCKFMKLLDFTKYDEFLSLTQEIKKITNLPNFEDVKKLMHYFDSYYHYYKWYGDYQWVLVIKNSEESMIEQYVAGYEEFTKNNGAVEVKILFKESDEVIVDVISKERFGIIATEYPGSADDAATYLYCNLQKL